MRPSQLLLESPDILAIDHAVAVIAVEAEIKAIEDAKEGKKKSKKINHADEVQKLISMSKGRAAKNG